MFNKNNEPLTDTLGQIEHQTVHTTQGQIVDLDEVQAEVVDSNGLAVASEDEQQLKEYIKKAISIDSLVETFNDNAHTTLLKLLALQDNKHPLKKGGVGIAYRTDALIMHCKMEFTADENIVFDAILGTMSSFPESKSYRIEPANFLSHSKYANPKYLYSVFSKGTKKLKDRHLVFEDLGPNGEDEISVPWFNILRYHNGKGNSSENSAYIEFVPSDFFKDLALCSQLVHGAYGALEVTTQLQGKYTIALYWFLENKKNYKEYPTATPGVFSISTEELKHQFSIPESYNANDIKRRVLEPAKKSINNVEECDFTFDYSLRKVTGESAGYLFTIKSKQYIENAETKMIEEKTTDILYDQIKMIVGTFYIDLSDDEIERVYKRAKALNKDGMYMTQIIMAFKQRLDDTNLEPVEDKVGYLCKMIEQGNVMPQRTIQNRNSFNTFMQNEYDYDELEKRLLDN
ncbi:Initiator Replication protein [Butyrivibrio fibrisolvens]|uniref:Initiator Replication protein n=1 Tax=Butyrivibrio fibrisolvens TaxID=831 RepID=A0A1H9VHI6_BUTFI|nr:replication initiation protein [Butyrivibrio fibrisolvens]SES21001.1 Initiator Replication protein [Butyrivibrio fibrisolvens]